MKKTTYLLVIIASMMLITSCGILNSKSKLKISKEAELLMSKKWEHQTTEVKNDTTGGKYVTQAKDKYYLKEIFVFDRDTKQKTKLAYVNRFGYGLLAEEILGYWTINKKGTEITLMEWDYDLAEEKAPVVFKIVKLTNEVFIIEDTNKGIRKTYIAVDLL